MRSGNTIDGRRAAAVFPPAPAAVRGRPPLAGHGARAPHRRRAPGTASAWQTSAANTCEAPNGRRALAAAGIPGARPPTRRRRYAPRRLLVRGGASVRPCGRCPKARRADRSPRWAQSERVRCGRLRRANAASACDLGGGRSHQDLLEREQAPLVLETEIAVAAEPVCPDNAVAGDEDRVTVARAERAGRARGPRCAGERGELTVGDDLPARDSAERPRTRLLERRQAVEIELGIVEADVRPGEER